MPKIDCFSRRLAYWLLPACLTAFGSPGGAAVLGSVPFTSAGPGGAPFTVEDLVNLKRVTDPQLSSDGRYVAYMQSETDLEANKSRSSLWVLDLSSGGAPRRLTDGKTSDSSPRWAPDTHTLYFLSARSGTRQVWRLTVPAGETQRVTNYSLDVGSMKVSPRGDRLAVSMDVFPDCPDLDCTRARLDARASSKATGRIYEQLFVRHWDAWRDGRRSHLFSVPLGADGTAGRPVDVSKSLDADVPPGWPLGGDEDYDFSPDGRSLVFSARIAGRTEPWSTNFDLYEMPADGSAPPVDLTTANPAWDAQPVFLRSGDLAWLAQDRPGFESDRFHVMLRRSRTGEVRPLTGAWDRSVSHLQAAPDGRHLLATVNEVGQHVLYSIDVKSGTRVLLVGTGEVQDYSAARDSIVFALQGLGGPADLYLLAARGAPKRLTDANHEILAARHLSEFEQFAFPGWHDETVYGSVVKPYGFEPGKRFPIAFLVHGGPQGTMQNAWIYRENAQAFAGRGYAVVSIDFHGSTGYGQAFTDSISHDWGGKPLLDLQKGLGAAIARYPWLDGERVCALGASFGGFMMYWIEGNWPDRFRCLVSHDGVFDQRMMYYATEEQWFPEWEMGGPQYENPQGYEQFNPIDHVSKWRTPMLVIHSELDFRVPYTQGLGAFTALQRRAIDSKLLVFPDENHFVLKPVNSLEWYHTVLEWLDAHLKN